MNDNISTQFAFDKQLEEGVLLLDDSELEVKKVFEQQPNYYNWLINADFPSNTKQIFTKIKLGQLK